MFFSLAESSRRRANTYEMPAKISCPLNRSISENYPPNNYYDEDPLSNRNSVITDFSKHFFGSSFFVTQFDCYLCYRR